MHDNNGNRREERNVGIIQYVLSKMAVKGRWLLQGTLLIIAAAMIPLFVMMPSTAPMSPFSREAEFYTDNSPTPNAPPAAVGFDATLNATVFYNSQQEPSAADTVVGRDVFFPELPRR